MRYPVTPSPQTQETLMSSDGMAERVSAIRESWQDRTYQSVVEATYAAKELSPTDLVSRAVIIDPDGSDIDESQSLVMSLPHLNGWTPHHYIRAKVTQQLIAPNSRIVVLPNNSFSQENYNLLTLNPRQQKMLSEGDTTYWGQRQVRTISKVNKGTRLGALKATGYSLGALTVITMAAHNNGELNITHVNADEMPSKDDRTAKELRKDFRQSGGISDLRKCIQESEIPALDAAMRLNRLALDLAKFGLKTFSKDAHIMEGLMTDTARSEVKMACDGIRKVKIGYVEGSKLFDPASLGELAHRPGLAHMVEYTGTGFRGHPSGDNVILHALMANQGLSR